MLLKLTNKQLQDLFELEKLEGRMCVRNRIDALGCFLGRYKIEPGPPVHRSATCEVMFAMDIQGKRPVALKLTRHRRPV